MKKKIVSLILSVTIILTSFLGFSTTAYAADKTYTSGDLTCSLNTSTGVFTVSGNGYGKDYSKSFSNHAPWYNEYSAVDISFVRNLIKTVVIEEGVKGIGNYWFYDCSNLNTIQFPETLEKIGSYAFADCQNSTFWIDIPKSVTQIGDHAFYNTKFNYVKIMSPSVSIGNDAFGCTDYARFFGLHNSGAYDYIKSGKDKGYNWFYYCLNDDHIYTTETVTPTCTERGYDQHYCIHCDVDKVQSNFKNALGHNYSSPKSDGKGFFNYICSRCEKSDLSISAVELLQGFPEAITTESIKIPFNQSNYNSLYDIYYDGTINAKDFAILEKALDEINVTNKQTKINENKKYQTIEGFGASAAWWAQDIGRWNEEQIDRVTELLYGDTGAGLSIYRYNLGGGSENDTHIGDWRRRAEDFLLPSSNINDPSTYDWSADAAAQKVLASAQKANHDLKLTLFSNSAPVSITDNGKAYCSNGADSNLSEKNYQAFANYVVNCAEHFSDMGYNVTSVSPINEPEWGWAADSSGNTSQEGCHWEIAQARKFYNDYLIPTLKNSSLNGKVDVSIWECAQMNYSTGSFLNKKYIFNDFLDNMFSNTSKFNSNNANIRNYSNSLDTHSYWASESDRRAVAEKLASGDYPSVSNVRCTEYCQMTNDGNNNVMGHITSEGGSTNGMTIDYALALADIMYQDLTILNAVEWDWWTACSGGIYPDALVYVDYNNPNNIQTSKRLWAMGNYSRFISEGAQRIEVSTENNFGKNLKTDVTYEYNNKTDKHSYIEQTAYKNPDGSVVIVYINNSDTDEFTFVSGDYKTMESYVTDENRDLEKYQNSNADEIIHIPSKSITTVILK